VSKKPSTAPPHRPGSLTPGTAPDFSSTMRGPGEHHLYPVPAGQRASCRASPPTLAPAGHGPGGRPRRRCTQSTPSAPPRQVNNPSRPKSTGNPLYRHAAGLGIAGPLAPLRRDPATAGIFSDFDGPLSPIVEDPDLAGPVAGVPGLLAELARRYAVVAVVSGRPVAFLAARLPASALLAGLHGLEVQRHGERQIDPEAERWRTAATRLRAAAPSGVLVEPEDLSATCHYRTNPSIEPQVMALAQEVAAATGLIVHRGRKSVELLPPIRADKGTVIRKLAAPLRSVCYLGDDLGDLAAFRALDQLATRGTSTARIAVRSDEAPAELLQAADVIIDAPEGAAGLLHTLL
jgi:trehalose 6-phosphate phosphatase